MMTPLAGSFFSRPFSYSRLWVLFAWGISIVLVLTARGIFRAAHRAVRARGVDVRRVLIVGSGPEARDLTRVLRTHPEYGQRPVAFVTDDSVSDVDGLPVVGTPPQVLHAVRRVGAHRVIIALPAEAREATLRVTAACQEAGVPFAIVPDLYALVARGAHVELVERLPLLPLRGTPLAAWGRWLKEARGIIGALPGVMLTLPLSAILALLIALDSPGPVFYQQRRIGKAAVPFYAWKFRTMVVGADERLARDSRLRERFAATFKLVDDPRVTSMGRC